MSAPDTNIKAQEKRHRPSLLGVKGAMIVAVLIAVLLVGYNVVKEPDVDGGTTGTAAQTDVYEPGTNSTATPAATD